MSRPARPIEAKVLSFVGFALVVIAGMVMVKSPLPTVLIGVAVAVAIRLAGLRLTRPEVKPLDIQVDERRAA
jgi:hypothetical protein